MSKTQKTITTTVRMPEDLKEMVDRNASLRGVSITSEMCDRLRIAYGLSPMVPTLTEVLTRLTALEKEVFVGESHSATDSS